MTETQLVTRIGKLRTRNQKRLNDIHIWSSLAIIALRRSLKDDAVLHQQEFVVPSSRADKTVLRKPEKVRQILSNAVSRELYSAVIVYIAAQVEAFLNDIIALVLRFDTRRLRTRVQGIETVKSVDLAEVLDSESKEDLVNNIIDKHLILLFYAKPSLQFDYLSRVVGVEVKPNLKDAWIELKATRDLIVHNSGIINEIYLQKCEALARGRTNERIEIDKDYFERSLANAKSLIGTTSSQLQKTFNAKK